LGKYKFLIQDIFNTGHDFFVFIVEKIFRHKLLTLVAAVIIQIILIQTAQLFWLYFLILLFSVWLIPKFFAKSAGGRTIEKFPVEPDYSIELNLRSIIFLGLFLYFVLLTIFFKDRMEKFPSIMQFTVAAAGFAGILLNRNKDKKSGYHDSIILDIAALAILIGFAAFTRFYAIGEKFPGINSDEVLFSDTARNLMSGMYKPSVFIGGTSLAQDTAGPYILTFFYNHFGISTVVLRLPAAVFAILTIISFYMFLRLFYRTDTAFLSSAILASNHVYLHLSRWMLLPPATAFFIWTSFGLVIYGFTRKNRLSLAFAGLIAGWSLYFYNASKFLVLMLAVYIIYETALALKEKRYKQPKEIFFDAGIVLTCFILSLLPLILYVIFNAHNYFSYLSAITSNNTKIIISNIGAYLGMLTVKGTGNTQLNYPDRPLLGLVETIFFLLGSGIVLSSLKKRISFIAAMLFIVGIIPGIFSEYWLPPSTQRAIIAFSASFLVIAAAINCLMNIGTGLKSLVAKAAVVFAVWISCVWGLETYFIKMLNDPEINLGFSPIELKIADLCKTNSETHNIYASRYFFGGWDDSYIFMGENIYFKNERKPELLAKQQFSVDNLLMFPYGHKDVLLIVDSFYKDSFDYIKKRFPDAVMTAFNSGRVWTPRTNFICKNILCPYYYGRDIDVITFNIPLKDIKEMEGLRFYYSSGRQFEGAFDFNSPSGENISSPGVFRGSIRIFDNGMYTLKFENFSGSSLKINGKKIRLSKGISERMKLYAAFYNIDIDVANVTGKEAVYIKSGDSDNFMPVEYGRFVKEIRRYGLAGTYTQVVKGSGSSLIRTDVTPMIYDRWLLNSMEGRKFQDGFDDYLICDWKGKIKIETQGKYGFGIAGGGQDAQIYIDGEEVFTIECRDDFSQGGYEHNDFPPVIKKMYLDKGFHNITIKMKQYRIAYCAISYVIMPDGSKMTPIPEEMLYPK